MKYPIGTKVIIGGRMWLPESKEDTIARGEVVGAHGVHRMVHLTEKPQWIGGKYTLETLNALLPDDIEVANLIVAAHRELEDKEEIVDQIRNDAQVISKARDEKLAAWLESHKAPKGR